MDIYFIYINNLSLHKNKEVLIIDQLAICYVIYQGVLNMKLYGGKNLSTLCAVICLIIDIILYGYGYCTDSFCYSEFSNRRQYFHALLHIFASLGHHSIISMVPNNKNVYIE